MELETEYFERFLLLLLRLEEVEDIMGEVEKKGGNISQNEALELLDPYPFTKSLFRQAWSNKILWTKNTRDLRDWLNSELTN